VAAPISDGGTQAINLIDLSAMQHALDFRRHARHLPIGTI